MRNVTSCYAENAIKILSLLNNNYVLVVRALGDRACRNGIKVLYFTMNMLIENLKLVHLEGRETNFFRKLNAHNLLIIDDFGMVRLEGATANVCVQINTPYLLYI